MRGGVQVVDFVGIVLDAKISCRPVDQELVEPLRTHPEVVKRMISGAPDTVVEVISTADDTKGFVRIVCVVILIELALGHCPAPILDIRVLMPCIHALFQTGGLKRDCCTVKIRAHEAVSN
jgi:hypothetical protein